ncbi:MAG: response regulator [Terriglobia bacterium]
MKRLAAVLLRNQGYAVFEYRGKGVFQPVGNLPDWFQNLPGQGGAKRIRHRLAERFPFIANFLLDARKIWRAKSGDWTKSGVWIERGRDGNEMLLECSAFSFQGRNVFIILNPHGHFEETRRTLQTARELRLQYDSFLRDVQKKEILIHCIIHDLSQPLTAMQGCFSSLGRIKLPRDLKALVQIGERQSHEQAAMIREVIEAFAAELSAPQASQRGAAEPPDLARCAMQIVNDFSQAFAEQDIRLELDPALDLTRNWQVAGDEARLRRIYANLLENALRHSPAGSRVTVRVLDEGRFLRACVDDRGPGLPSGEAASRLFQLFARGKERGGKAGIGLYFCRITVERWGGTVGCEPRPGGGARFWFRVPRYEPTRMKPRDVASPAKKPPEEPGRSGVARPAEDAAKDTPRPRRVLLAEDNPVIRKLTTRMLKERGHKVTAVCDGKEALARIREKEFDVVLMDVEMPKVSGIEAARAIRQLEKAAGTHLSVIALTAYASKYERIRCLSAGMDSCLTKPFKPEDLYASVEDPAIPPLEINVAEKVEPAVGAERHAALLARVGGKQKLLNTLVRLFLEDYPKHLSAIDRAIIRRDGKNLARAAHALRGPIGLFFGDGETAFVTRKLETMGFRAEFTGAERASAHLRQKLSTLCDELRSLQRVSGMAQRPRPAG